MTMSNPFLLLHADDNVLVCCRPFPATSSERIDNKWVVVTGPIEVGHKIARFDIGTGDKIVKHGAPIGTATRRIRRGEHVHLMELKSDYLPTHERGSASRKESA